VDLGGGVGPKKSRGGNFILRKRKRTKEERGRPSRWRESKRKPEKGGNVGVRIGQEYLLEAVIPEIRPPFLEEKISREGERKLLCQ